MHALAARIVAGPGDQGAHSLHRLFAGGALHGFKIKVGGSADQGSVAYGVHVRERFFPGLSCAGTKVPEMTRATLYADWRPGIDSRGFRSCPSVYGPKPHRATVTQRQSDDDPQLYDTMAREKRPFVPHDPRRVTMYVCGPTVYNYAHIGNFRPVVVFDVLFRLLRRLYGEDAVLYAANVTDVDDKINAKAAEEGVADRRRSPTAT